MSVDNIVSSLCKENDVLGGGAAATLNFTRNALNMLTLQSSHDVNK